LYILTQEAEVSSLSKIVTVKFFANIEIAMGKKEMRLVFDDLEKLTVGHVVAEISKLERKDMGNLGIDENGKSRGTVRIAVNDELLLQDPFGVSVHDGDTILIFPLLAGG
jgi:molybdopterin converting factor small subunit